LFISLSTSSSFNGRDAIIERERKAISEVEEGKLSDDVSKPQPQPFMITFMVFSPVGKKKLAGQCEYILLLREVKSDWDVSIRFSLLESSSHHGGSFLTSGVGPTSFW